MTYEDLLEKICRERDDVVVMTAENRAAIRGLPAKLGARFIDVGIAEQTMIGAAAGLALRGRTPIVHALATFLCFRAYEFIRDDVGIAHLPVKLIGGVPGFLSDGNGPTHQAIEDVSLMRGIPGMKVVCPADENDLLACMPAVIADRAPCYVRYNARKGTIDHAPFAFGKAEVVAEGRDVAILTYGFLLEEARVARESLEKKGLSARIVNLRSVWPIDEAEVLRACRECARVVTFEDHFLVGGLYSIVAELLLRHRTTARVLPVALDGRWFKPALLSDVLKHEGFTGAQLADRILADLEK